MSTNYLKIYRTFWNIDRTFSYKEFKQTIFLYYCKYLVYFPVLLQPEI